MHTRKMMAAVLSVALLSGVAQADMDANQKKWFGEATKYIEQGEASLKVAKDGVGSPVTASKAKLGLARLGAVKTAYGNANLRIEKLPADDASVAALAARSKALEEATTTFEQSLLNPDKPAGPAAQPNDAPKAPAAGGGAPPAPAGNVKLDYRQRESFKNAEFHVGSVVLTAEALAKLADKVSKATDPSTIDVRDLQSGMNAIADAKQKTKNANTHLASLPANGEGVAELTEQLKQATELVAASEKIIAPAHEKMVGSLDPKNLPTLQQDQKRLQELAQMYSDDQLFRRNVLRAAELVTLLPEAVKEHDRIVQVYAAPMKQETEDGRRFTGSSNYFKEQVARFNRQAAEQKAGLPGAIDADLAEANRMADIGVKEKLPAYFNDQGDIKHRMQWASDKVVLLKTLDPAAATAAEEKIAAARKTMKEREESLRADIVSSNTLPNDNYAGPDRKELEKIAIESWKTTQSDFELLKVIIPSEQWQRENIWRYENSAWRFLDRSRLQVQLILKHDDKLAVNRPVTLLKDHVNGDKITGYNFDGKTDEVPPQRYYLLEKVK